MTRAQGTEHVWVTRLRAALGRFTTGVAVVTVAGPDGPVGITVNSFASITLDPPLVLFCLHNRSRIRHAFDGTDIFAVNVLGATQQHVSHAFTTGDTPTGSPTTFDTGSTGAPLVPDSIAVLECVRRDEVVIGDRILVISEVLDCSVRDDGAPLVFFASSYTGLQRVDGRPTPEPDPPADEDYGLVLPITLPAGEAIPDALSGRSTPEEYDRYFRIHRESHDLADWTKTCMTVSHELLDDLATTDLSPQDRTALLSGLVVAQAETLDRWLRLAVGSST